MTMTINVAVFLALILETVILYVINLQDYKRTSQMLMNQTMEVIEKNDSREKEMLESLKEDYKVRVNAVAYILDAKPEVENDLNELKKIAAFMSVDEIHLFDENGVIYGGTIPKYYGYSFDSGEQMAYFTPMLQDKDLTMCQDVTPNTSEGRSMMYAITWNNAGTKMIQVGIEPKRLIDEMNQNQISAVISNMPMYTGINIFVADSGDGKILGSTKAAMVGKTLNDVGISRDKVTEQADVPAICYRNIDGIVSRCAFDRTDDYIVVVTCNLLSNIKTDVIIMVIMIVYFIIAAKALASMFTKLDRVRRSAYTDELTGCFNRKAYQENVEEYWKSPDMVYISMDVNGLKKVYTTRFGGSRVQALTNVTFAVERGEYVAIMGESGSGKTTLLNILAALDRPTEGEVFLNGRALSTIGEKEIASFRRQNLGFVFQDFNLLDTFTLQDNIFLPLVLAGKHFPEMQAKLLPLAQQLGRGAGALVFEQRVDKVPARVLFLLAGQQHARFDEHQLGRVVDELARDLHIQPPHRFDVRHVLLGNLGNGDVEDVQLILGNQRQQQVEGAFVLLDFEVQLLHRAKTAAASATDRSSIWRYAGIPAARTQCRTATGTATKAARCRGKKSANNTPAADSAPQSAAAAASRGSSTRPAAAAEQG